jgi:ubiquinone/menaquinone biosynthesis C-methylase UbiE
MDNEFDSYASEYQKKINNSISIFGQQHDFFVSHKTEKLLQAFSEIGILNELKIVDVGCGIGLGHAELSESVSELNGVDVSMESIDIAKSNNPKVKYKTYDGKKLPFENNTFDCAYAICVLHHVPKDQWQLFIDEMNRVLKPGGLLIIIEHNPLNPATQWVVRTCELDKHAILLSGWRLSRLFHLAKMQQIKINYLLFTPFTQIFFRKLDKLLSSVPFGAQFLIKGRKSTT